ncbi:MAG: hypothetical protein KF819_20950 [Labilithrix sp.]|nr:hypothetical protein [Labilithrix sp.]
MRGKAIAWGLSACGLAFVASCTGADPVFPPEDAGAGADGGPVGSRCKNTVSAPGAAFHFDACEVEVGAGDVAGNWKDRVTGKSAIGDAVYDPTGAGVQPAVKFTNSRYVFAHASANDVANGSFALVVVGRYSASSSGRLGAYFASKTNGADVPVGALLYGKFFVNDSDGTTGVGAQLKFGEKYAHVAADQSDKLLVMTMWRTSTALAFRLNGVEAATTPVAASDAFDSQGKEWTFGGGLQDERNLAGVIAEIILVKEPAAGVVEKLEADLKARYAL